LQSRFSQPKPKTHIKGSQTDLQLPKVGEKTNGNIAEKIKSATGAQLSATLKAF